MKIIGCCGTFRLRFRAAASWVLSGRTAREKSTLLKIVAGLLDATTGSAKIRGRVSAILELGTGFHPDFTGRQNIITGGMCLGMSRAEIEDRQKWIIDFSELETVIDKPFRTYSTGMQARLTFATAVSINPEIFIVDEALAAGDAYFVSKCIKRIHEICSSGATVLFVSHGTNQVAQMCKTAVWLQDGHVHMIGPARDVAKEYDYAVHVRVSQNAGRLIEVANEQIVPVTAAKKDAPADVANVQSPNPDEASITSEATPDADLVTVEPPVVKIASGIAALASPHSPGVAIQSEEVDRSDRQSTGSAVIDPKRALDATTQTEASVHESKGRYAIND